MSERVENLNSFKLSGAYLENRPFYTMGHITKIGARKNNPVFQSIKVLLATKKCVMFEKLFLYLTIIEKY